jgi:hypothetical protein
MEAAEAAFYRSADPVEHLLLRLSIRRRGGGYGGAEGMLVPLAGMGGGGVALGASVPLASPALPPGGSGDGARGAAVAADVDDRVFEFGWQQKVLGPR